MRYDPSIGVMGNIKKLYEERNRTNNSVFNNKSEADSKHEESINGLCEVAEVSSDTVDASMELAELVSQLTEKVAELEQTIETMKNEVK